MKFLVYVDVGCRDIEHGTAIINDMLNHRKIFSGGIEPMKISWTILPEVDFLEENKNWNEYKDKILEKIRTKSCNIKGKEEKVEDNH